MVEFAQRYIKQNGPDDPIFQMYFGDNDHAYATTLGVYESIMSSDKTGVLFRCDNIDGVSGFLFYRLLRVDDLYIRTASSPDGEDTGEVTMRPPRLSSVTLRTPTGDTISRCA